MNKFQKLLISSILNVFTFISAAWISIDMFFTRGEGNMLVSNWNIFRYFTIDSNILCGVACLIYTVFNILNYYKNREIPKWVLLVKSSLTAAITVTFITCVFFLGPTMGYLNIFLGKNAFLHAINPLAAMIALMFFEEGRLTKIETLFTIAPTAVYSFVYVPCILTKVWDDFYGFTFGGNYFLVPIVLIIMYAVSYGLGISETLVKNRINKETFALMLKDMYKSEKRKLEILQLILRNL